MQNDVPKYLMIEDRDWEMVTLRRVNDAQRDLGLLEVEK